MNSCQQAKNVRSTALDFIGFWTLVITSQGWYTAPVLGIVIRLVRNIPLQIEVYTYVLDFMDRLEHDIMIH